MSSLETHAATAEKTECERCRRVMAVLQRLFPDLDVTELLLLVDKEIEASAEATGSLAAPQESQSSLARPLESTEDLCGVVCKVLDWGVWVDIGDSVVSVDPALLHHQFQVGMRLEGLRVIETDGGPFVTLKMDQPRDEEVEIPTVEKTVEVPQVQSVEEILEVPEVRIQEERPRWARRVPKTTVQEVVHVPKIEVLQERIVEHPQVHQVEKIVEVPQAVIQTVDRHVPKIEEQETVDARGETAHPARRRVRGAERTRLFQIALANAGN